MTDELYHYGVKGMKWGVRRAEKKRAKEEKYGTKESRDRVKRERNKLYGRYYESRYNYKESSSDKDYQKSQKDWEAIQKFDKEHAKELQQISNYDHRNDGKKLAAFVVASFGGVILSSMAIASAADAGEKLVKRMLSK